MKKVLLILCCVTIVFGQLRWAQRGRVRDHTEFFEQLMQEMIYEIERRGFSTLTMVDIKKIIDEPMYSWKINGTVVYTNGFVVSIQKIDITRITQQITNPNVNGAPAPRASVGGLLNLRDIKIGYDVIFTHVDGSVNRFTGDFTHILISWQINIVKDLTTKEITIQMSSNNSGGSGVRMIYRPASNLTEVLSRNFRPFNTGDGIRTWIGIFEPIIRDLLKSKVPYPEVCFSHC